MLIGVEGSKDMAGFAEQICLTNGLSQQQGGPITIVAGQVEQLEELPVQQVPIALQGSA